MFERVEVEKKKRKPLNVRIADPKSGLYKGYTNKDHYDAAKFFFRHVMEGRVSYHTERARPRYSGNDVRHVLQAHGWVYEEYLVKYGRGLTEEQVRQVVNPGWKLVGVK